MRQVRYLPLLACDHKPPSRAAPASAQLLVCQRCAPFALTLDTAIAAVIRWELRYDSHAQVTCAAVLKHCVLRIRSQARRAKFRNSVHQPLLRPECNSHPRVITCVQRHLQAVLAPQTQELVVGISSTWRVWLLHPGQLRVGRARPSPPSQKRGRMTRTLLPFFTAS